MKISRPEEKQRFGGKSLVSTFYQSSLIENDNLPFLNVPVYAVRKMTILVFNLTFFKDDLYVHYSQSDILKYYSWGQLTLFWWIYFLVMLIIANILMTVARISPPFEDAVSHLSWLYLLSFWEFGLDPIIITWIGLPEEKCEPELFCISRIVCMLLKIISKEKITLNFPWSRNDIHWNDDICMSWGESFLNVSLLWRLQNKKDSIRNSKMSIVWNWTILDYKYDQKTVNIKWDLPVGCA